MLACLGSCLAALEKGTSPETIEAIISAESLP